MAKVIDLKDRKKLLNDLKNTNNLDGLRSLLRCHYCPGRCSKCGAHGGENAAVRHRDSGLRFRFCPACMSEYQYLTTHLDGRPDPEAPAWYNRTWLRQWLAWLDYQTAVVDYIESPEVLEVLDRLSSD